MARKKPQPGASAAQTPQGEPTEFDSARGSMRHEQREALYEVAWLRWQLTPTDLIGVVRRRYGCDVSELSEAEAADFIDHMHTTRPS